MKRPTVLHFFFGHPLVGLAIFAAACVVWVRWWQGEAAGVGAVLMLFAVLMAGQAFDTVNDYRHKVREWKALAGEPLDGVSLQQLKGLRIALAIILWGGMAYMAYDMRNDPEMKIAVWLFVAGSVIGFSNLIWTTRRKPSAKAQKWKDVPVTQCLRVSSRSPSLGQTVFDLPETFAALLAQ
jgi:hypothetical protein